MAQDGTTAGGSSYTIDNVTFPVGRTKLQSIFDAIRSTNIGNTAPDLVAGQFWIDNNTPSTTVWTLYFYDGTDNISFATIDTINNTVNFTDSALDLVTDLTPQLGGNLDLNSNDITGTGNINITGTIESSGNITGTLATAAQPNITSVGTLASQLTVSISTLDTIAQFLGSNGNLKITNPSNNTINLELGSNDALNIQTLSTGTAFRINSNGDVGFYEDTGTTPKMFWDASTERLGIGTSSPYYQVDCRFDDSTTTLSGGTSGNFGGNGIRIQNNNTTAGTMALAHFRSGDNADWHIGNKFIGSNNSDFIFFHEANEIMRIDGSTGNLGIGTSSPLRKFNVYDSANSIVGRIQSGQSSSWLQFSASGNGTASRIGSPDGASIASIALMTSDQERMRINSSGNVGINTSSPSARFNILESTVGTDPTSDSSNFIKLTNNDISTVNEVFGIGFSSLSGVTDYLGAFIQALGNYNLNFNHSLIFGTRGTSGNATERMRIDSSGNVGINTSSPAPAVGTDKVLEIAGSVSPGLVINDTGQAQKYQLYADSTKFKMSYGSTNFFTYDASNGNLGVGTTTPNTKLDIVGTGVNGIELGQQSDNTGNSSRLFFNNSTNIWTAYSTTGSFKIASGATIGTSSGTDRLVIDSSGRVGIGVTSLVGTFNIETSNNNHIYLKGTTGEAYGLWVADDGNRLNIGSWTGHETIRFDSTNQNIQFRTATGAERMRIDASGKVGINTTSPYGKFEVHSGGGGTNYTGSSAIKSGVSWGSESSSHTIDLWNYNEADNTSGMLLVHAKADSSKCGTLMLLFTKRVGQFVKITTISSKLDGMSTFSASTSGNSITISTDSDCAICWQSYYGV